MLLNKFAHIRLATYLVVVVILAFHFQAKKRVIPADLTGITFPEITTKDLRNPTLPRLDTTDKFPAIYREAATSIGSAIQNEGLNPAEYFAELRIEEANHVLRFDLWHQSVVGENYDPGWKGDRSGKCRTVRYDPLQGKVLEIHGWR